MKSTILNHARAQRPLRALLLLLCVTGAAVAQGLSPSEKSQLRKLKYYVEQVEGQLGMLGKTAPDRRAGLLDSASRVLTRAGSALAKLPAESPAVVPFAARLKQAKERLAASRAGKRNGDANGGELSKAREEMRKLAEGLGRSTAVLGEVAHFTLLGRRWKELEARAKACGRAHADAMKQSSGPGWELRRVYDDVTRRMERIERAVANSCKPQAQQLAARLERMTDFVEKAVAKKNARVFGQYVANETKAQREILDLLDAWGYPTDEARARLAETTARMAELEAQLAGVIVKRNRVPADRYRGKDRDALAARVRAEWQKAHPQDEILALRFPDGSWKRDRRTRAAPASRTCRASSR